MMPLTMLWVMRKMRKKGEEDGLPQGMGNGRWAFLSNAGVA